MQTASKGERWDVVPEYMSRQFKADGWYSMLTGLGTTTHDKTRSTAFFADIVTMQDAVELYRGDDLAARIVEALPDEMLREGFKFNVSDDAEGNDEDYGKELVERVRTAWDNIDLVPVLHEALCYMRAYGGSAILLGVDDGAEDLREPLRTEHRHTSFEWLTVLEPRELHPVEWYTNPRAPKFGKPSMYMLTPVVTGAPKPGEQLVTTMHVHESRLIVLDGNRVSRVQQRGSFGAWGDSVFTRVYRVLRDFNVSWSAAGILVSDFAQPVFKIENLAQIMERDNKELFEARMRAIALSMSTARAVLIDTNEEYKREQTPVTGLPELLELFCKRLAAAANIPVSILFGESPGGLNASGASGDQMRIFYDRVRSMQNKILRPIVRRITKLLLATMGGEPDDWSIDFNPLYAPSEKEQADTEEVKARTARTHWEMGALGAEEVRRSPGFAAAYGIDVKDRDTAAPTPEDLAALAAPVAADPVEAAPVAADPGASVDVQKQALNGAQITSLVEIIKAVALGELPASSAQKVIEMGFQLSPADALAMMPPPDFKPAAPDAPSVAPDVPPPVPPAPGAPPFVKA